MSDIYEEYEPSLLKAYQLPTQPSTSKEEGPKEKLENKGSTEHPDLKRTFFQKDSESDTHEYFREITSLEEDNYLLENKYAYDQVNALEEEPSWKKNQEVEEDDIYENIYEDNDLDASSSHLLPRFSMRESLLNVLSQPVFPLESKYSPLWKDQSTQTEWKDQSRASESKPGKFPSTYTSFRVIKSYSKEDIIIDLPRERKEKQEDAEHHRKTVEDRKFEVPSEILEREHIDDVDDLWKSCQAKLESIISEMKENNELEGDLDISMMQLLDPKTQKKLVLLLKKYDSSKEAIKWFIRKNEALIRNAKTTLEFRLSHELKTQTVDHKKKTEEETEWIQEPKIPHSDGKITFYPGEESIFQILFPDGSGQIHYPSGNLAMLTLGIKEKKITYVILEDSEKITMRGLVNNTGHATFYDVEQGIWVNLSPSLGFYFPKDKSPKVWNWWNLSIHVHAPPLQPISLQLNGYITVHIKNQDHITFRFTHRKQHMCLNLGTKYKPLAPEVLTELKGETVLQVDVSRLARKIQVLLSKISKLLHLVSAAHLEDFHSAQREVFVGRRWVSVPSMLWLELDTQGMQLPVE